MTNIPVKDKILKIMTKVIQSKERKGMKKKGIGNDKDKNVIDRME